MLIWNIREAQNSDLDQLIEMRLALQKHYEERNPHVWRMSLGARAGLRDEMTDFLSDEKARIFVSVNNDGYLVGMLICKIIESERYLPSISGRMDRLFVSAAYRRCGIATQLVKQACQFFAENNVEEISVGYLAGNTEAILFWDRLGFQPRLITTGTKLHDLENNLAGEV